MSLNQSGNPGLTAAATDGMWPSNDPPPLSQPTLSFTQASPERHLPNGSGPRKLRVALYSHDTMGMGHMRRNLLISQALSYSSLQTSILMVAGARQAGVAQMPPGVDCVTLPALHKQSNGRYLSRSLDIPIQDLTRMRAQMIRASIAAFNPDIFIVDNVPRGALGELDATLSDIRRRGHTTCVLGLRDVLDEPVQVQSEWRKANNEQTIRDFYHKVWIYGDPRIYDAVREYRLPSDIADKVSYTGYFDRRTLLQYNAGHDAKRQVAELGLPEGRFALCMVGGGQDGARLTKAFAFAKLPADIFGVIVTGPFMPAQQRAELHRIAATRSNLKVLEFVNEPTWLLNRADYVIAMGGYNIISEILSFEKHALIVPRVSPRQEQLVRAERLKTLGLVDIAHPEHVTSAQLSAWLDNAIRHPSKPSVHAQFDFNGLSRLPGLVTEVCRFTQ